MMKDYSESNHKESDLASHFKLIIFRVKDQLFCFEIEKIQEVIRSPRIMPTHSQSEFIEGVIDLRENIIPVVSLSNLLYPKHESGVGERIIIVDLSQYIFGLIVDHVNEVIDISSDEFQPPPPGIRVRNSSYIKGIAHLKNQILFFLDIENIFDLEQLLQNENPI